MKASEINHCKENRKMKTKNYEAIDNALKLADTQLEKMVFSGDHENAKVWAMILIEIKVALLDEAAK